MLGEVVMNMTQRNLYPRFVLLLVVSICPAGDPRTGTLQAGEPGWKVGLARIKITPERPVFLSGYASRNKPFEKIENDLFAKAMVLEDGAGRRAVLVTTDIIGFPAAIAEAICAAVQKKLDLKREQILLNSSHIHTGPMLSLTAKPGKAMTAADVDRTIEYTRQLQKKVVEVITEAAFRLEPAKLSWGSGVAHFVMNRRQFVRDEVILGANPRGLADRTVPVLRVDAPDGKLRAVLFGAAVHNTTLVPSNYELCGDYAGFAQAHVERRYPEALAMFMIGCAGDADPYPRGSMALARQHGLTLGKEVERVLDGKLRPIRGPLAVAFEQADLPLQKLTRAELQDLAGRKRGIQPGIAREMLARMERGEKLPETYRCPFAVWQFGKDLTLVGLSGEVVVDYVPLLEKALGPTNLWLAAYCNDVYGYLPSARVIDEGGYETRGIYTGGIGFFDRKAQEVVVETVRKLATDAGRQTAK
jgi:hypothetical protein